MSASLRGAAKFKLAFALSFFSAAFATSASAVTISTADKSVDLSCSGSCEFWYLDPSSDPDGFSATSGSWLSASYGALPVRRNGNSNNSNDNRLSFVNTVLGLDGISPLTTQSASSDDNVGGGGIDDPDGQEYFSWTGSGQYYLAWSAGDPRYILIRNNSEDNTFTWDGKGLSGLDAFGTIAPVPLPPAVLMLLAGLGGLVVIGKRKSRAT